MKRILTSISNDWRLIALTGLVIFTAFLLWRGEGTRTEIETVRIDTLNVVLADASPRQRKRIIAAVRPVLERVAGTNERSRGATGQLGTNQDESGVGSAPERAGEPLRRGRSGPPAGVRPPKDVSEAPRASSPVPSQPDQTPTTSTQPLPEPPPVGTSPPSVTGPSGLTGPVCDLGATLPIC